MSCRRSSTPASSAPSASSAMPSTCCWSIARPAFPTASSPSRAPLEVVVVVCNRPASITDAYALIKLLSRDYGVDHLRVLANRVAGHREGRGSHTKLVKVTDRFLDVTLSHIGSIPEDAQLRRAIQMQQAVVDAFPSARASASFCALPRTSSAGRCQPAERPSAVLPRTAGRCRRALTRRARRPRETRHHVARILSLRACPADSTSWSPGMRRRSSIACHLLARLPASVQIDDLIQTRYARPDPTRAATTPARARASHDLRRTAHPRRDARRDPPAATGRRARCTGARAGRRRDPAAIETETGREAGTPMSRCASA